MSDSRNPHAGIEALLTPQNSVLLLIDHQGFQFANLHSHEPQLVVNNVVGLAKTAKLFDVPTILTTVLEERGGHIIKGIQSVFPEQEADQSDVHQHVAGRPRGRRGEEDRPKKAPDRCALDRGLPRHAGHSGARRGL